MDHAISRSSRAQSGDGLSEGRAILQGDAVVCASGAISGDGPASAGVSTVHRGSTAMDGRLWRSRLRSPVCAALLLAVIFLIKSPVLSFAPVYEDANDYETLYRPFQVSDLWMKPARVLTTASFSLTHVLSVQPSADHAVNLAVHLVNTALLLWLLRGVGLEPSLWLAGVFAVHPLNVEAVSYVSARPDLLSTTFLLLALCAASVGAVALAVCGVVLAVLGKETALVAAGLVPLWAAWTGAIAWRRWRWFAAPVAVALVFVAYRGVHFSWRPALEGAVFAQTFRLLALVVWPVGFTVDHDWGAITNTVALVAFLAAVGLTLWSVTEGWQKRSGVALAWLWVLIAISPRLVVSLFEGLHEHHFYNIGLGLTLSAGAVFAKPAH